MRRSACEFHLNPDDRLGDFGGSFLLEGIEVLCFVRLIEHQTSVEVTTAAPVSFHHETRTAAQEMTYQRQTIAPVRV